MVDLKDRAEFYNIYPKYSGTLIAYYVFPNSLTSPFN